MQKRKKNDILCRFIHIESLLFFLHCAALYPAAIWIQYILNTLYTYAPLNRKYHRVIPPHMTSFRLKFKETLPLLSLFFIHQWIFIFLFNFTVQRRHSILFAEPHSHCGLNQLQRHQYWRVEYILLPKRIFTSNLNLSISWFKESVGTWLYHNRHFASSFAVFFFFEFLPHYFSIPVHLRKYSLTLNTAS